MTAVQKPLNLLLVLASIVIIIAGLHAGAGLLVPFLLSVFIAVIVSPPVFYLQKYVSLTVSVILVISAVIIVIFLLANMIGVTIGRFSSELPMIESQLTDAYTKALNWLAGMGIQLDKKRLSSVFNPGSLTQFITSILSQIGSVFSQSFIIILMIVFMLFEAASYNRKLGLASKNPERAIAVSQKIVHALRQYLSIKTVVSLGTGVIIGVACLLLQVKFALLWGLLAFLLNFIPNIGSILAAVPAIIISFIDPDNSLTTTALLAACYLSVNMLVGNIIEPKVMGKGMGLSTLVAFVSLIFWGWVFGMIGMFLSVPLTMALKTLLETSSETRAIAIMLASEESIV